MNVDVDVLLLKSSPFKKVDFKMEIKLNELWFKKPNSNRIVNRELIHCMWKSGYFEGIKLLIDNCLSKDYKLSDTK
jgi:hypothetical protein